MRTIADFHIHSKFSRACSPRLELETIAAWSKIKGIQVVSCADFTHPAWFSSIKEKLEDSPFPGLFQLKPHYERQAEEAIRTAGFFQKFPDLHFILSTEISCIYSKGGSVRRVHLLIFSPSIAVVEKINAALGARGKLASDGRPILGMDAKELLRIVLDISPECFMIPAHAWTPWFAVFGSKSGFNAIEECFEELTPNIFAIETGLSSDPLMNWRLSQLNEITLISCSDAHSPEHLGREANIFEGTSLSYSSLRDALKAGKKGTDGLRLDSTIEFYPEEGMYHLDGHRTCRFSCEPHETKRLGGRCPICKRPLTVGVLNRVMELADQDPESIRARKAGYAYIVPLPEIIAQCCGVKSAHSKKVQKIYQELINRFGSEFEILLNSHHDADLRKISKEIADGIQNMREKNVKISSGYDGVYGTITVHESPVRTQDALFAPEV
jgi:DNA helicase II / ATP-dependent DNA helicase PcrA